MAGRLFDWNRLLGGSLTSEPFSMEIRWLGFGNRILASRIQVLHFSQDVGSCLYVGLQKHIFGIMKGWQLSRFLQFKSAPSRAGFFDT